MPYFDPFPVEEQWRYWIQPQDEDPLISRWPKAGSNRNDCRFNLPISKGEVWTASRWYVEWSHSDPSGSWWFRGWLDLEAVGVNHLRGSTGFNAEGWQIILDIKGYDSLPITGHPGVETITRVEHETEPWWMDDWAQFWDDGFFPWETVMRLGMSFNDEDGVFFSPVFPPGQNLTNAGSVADCFTWPLIQVAEGFCQCNGVDAYVQLDNLTPFFGWPSKVECDVRFRSLTNAIFLGAAGGGANSFYIDGTQWHFSGNSGTISPLPALDTWLHMEFERGWHNPASGFRNLRFDGQLVSSAFGANFAIQADRVGGNVPVPPTMWADMDLKNLHVDNGDVNNPNPILDLPFLINACDAGPLTNNGTTFNMPLPSCPP